MCKNEGLAESPQARFMFCADFRKPSERSSREIQWDVSLFFDI